VKIKFGFHAKIRSGIYSLSVCYPKAYAQNKQKHIFAYFYMRHVFGHDFYAFTARLTLRRENLHTLSRSK